MEWAEFAQVFNARFGGMGHPVVSYVDVRDRFSGQEFDAWVEFFAAEAEKDAKLKEIKQRG